MKLYTFSLDLKNRNKILVKWNMYDMIPASIHLATQLFNLNVAFVCRLFIYSIAMIINLLHCPIAHPHISVSEACKNVWFLYPFPVVDSE